jgi:ribonucleoside-diphosphate reductase alpha chain
LAAIGEVIERHMIDIGFMPDARREREEMLQAAVAAGKELPGRGQGGDGNLIQGSGSAGRSLPLCPKCTQPAMIRQEGCDLCTSCGYSRCG